MFQIFGNLDIFVLHVCLAIGEVKENLKYFLPLPFFWIEPNAIRKVPLLYTSGLSKKKHFILFTWSKKVI